MQFNKTVLLILSDRKYMAFNQTGIFLQPILEFIQINYYMHISNLKQYTSISKPLCHIAVFNIGLIASSIMQIEFKAFTFTNPAV